MTYEQLTALFEHNMAKNHKVQRLLELIRSGKASFSDTADYSNLVSSIFSYLIKRYVPGSENAEEVTQKLLVYYHKMINDVLGEVQMSIDEATGLHIRPQCGKFPKERVRKFTHSLIDPTVPEETIRRRARSGSQNIARSFHDDTMRANAELRSKAGVRCYIVRTTDGNCCPWCTKLAGRYDYETVPEDVFRRHDNCGCTVIYENGRQRQDVWSKRMWTVSEDLKAPYQPTVLTPEQAKALQDEKLQVLGVDKYGKSGIIESRGENMINAIELPIEQKHSGKGNPNAILTFDIELNNRQSELLKQLPEYDSRITVPKKSVNMADLSALTAKTGDEFAMFTKGELRLIIRGNESRVNVSVEDAERLASLGYRWSGHTHPGTNFNCLTASLGDIMVLEKFSQKVSVIYNSKGQYLTFGKD